MDPRTSPGSHHLIVSVNPTGLQSPLYLFMPRGLTCFKLWTNPGKWAGGLRVAINYAGFPFSLGLGHLQGGGTHHSQIFLYLSDYRDWVLGDPLGSWPVRPQARSPPVDGAVHGGRFPGLCCSGRQTPALILTCFLPHRFAGKSWRSTF